MTTSYSAEHPRLGTIVIGNCVPLRKCKGLYLLILDVPRDIILLTKRRKFIIKRGKYVYVGSAFQQGGLPARINRHLHDKKKLFWHIDFLLQYSIINTVILITSFSRKRDLEAKISYCIWKKKFFEPIRGFGASDLKSVLTNLYRYKRSNNDITELENYLLEILLTTNLGKELNQAFIILARIFKRRDKRKT